MFRLEQGRVKTIDQVKSEYKNFPAFVLVPFSSNSREVLCNVTVAGKTNCYSWILPVPLRIYEKINKSRFTGQDIIDNYSMK
jgi:hypothetical protein